MHFVHITARYTHKESSHNSHRLPGTGRVSANSEAKLSIYEQKHHVSCTVQPTALFRLAQTSCFLHKQVVRICHGILCACELEKQLMSMSP